MGETKKSGLEAPQARESAEAAQLGDDTAMTAGKILDPQSGRDIKAMDDKSTAGLVVTIKPGEPRFREYIERIQSLKDGTGGKIQNVDGGGADRSSKEVLGPKGDRAAKDDPAAPLDGSKKAVNLESDYQHLTQILKDLKGGARTPKDIARDLIDSISTLNREQIDNLSLRIKGKDGQSLEEILAQDKSIPKAYKDALNIYLKGSENRFDIRQSESLIKTALEPPDIVLFERVMRDASFSARTEFLQNGGKDKILEKFGTAISDENNVPLGYRPSKESRLATDYAEYGHARLSTLLKEQYSIFGTDDNVIKAVMGQISDEQKQQVLYGARLDKWIKDGGHLESLSPSQKEAREEYQKVFAELKSMGNDTKALKWLDTLDNGGTELVSKLAQHRGRFHNSSETEILKDLRALSQADWQKLNNDPAYKERVTEVLKTLLPYMTNADRMIQALTENKDAGYEQSKNSTDFTYKELSDAARRGDSKDFIRALETMDDWFKGSYANPNQKEFREYYDKLVDGLKSDVAKDAAREILSKISRGEAPELGLESKLRLEAEDRQGLLSSEKRRTLVDMVEAAFKKDPSLKDRVLSTRPEDAKLQEAFHAAFPKLAGWPGQIDAPRPQGLNRFEPIDLFDAYIKPLAQNGKLSLQERASLGTYDRKTFLNDIANASPDDRKKFLEDPVFQHRLTGYWSESELGLAKQVARTGFMGLEDSLRLGLITGNKKQVQDIYTAMPDVLKPALNELYERKYGDLKASISGSFRNESDRRSIETLSRPANPDERANYHEGLTDYSKQKDGWFAKFVGQISGSGVLADDALHRYAAQMSKLSLGQDLSPQELQKAQKGLQESLTLFMQSKEHTADTIADLTVATLAIGMPGGGASLILRAAAMGALLKPGLKDALIGTDAASQSLLRDFFTGAANGAFNAFTPAYMAKVLGLGDRLGQLTADVLKGQRFVAEGREVAFTTALQDLAKNTIGSRSGIPDGKTLEKIASAFALPGQKEALITAIQNEFAVQSYSLAKDFLKAEVLPNALSAGIGSGGVSAIDSIANDKSAQEVLSRALVATALGMAMGTTVTAGLGGKEALRRSSNPATVDSLTEGILGRTVPLASAILRKEAAELAAKTQLPLNPLKGARPLDEVFEAPTKGHDSFYELKKGAKKRDYKTLEDFSADAVLTDFHDSVRYKIKGSNVEIVMKPEYAGKLDEVRKLRLAAEQINSSDPALAKAAREAEKTLSKHPLKDAVLPEQVAQAIVESPNNGQHLKKVILEDSNHPEDTFNKRHPVLGEAHRDGIITIFPKTSPQDLRWVFSHENAHIIDFRHLENTPFFNTAAELERNGFFARSYAKKNDLENWAVHFGEEFLHANSSNFGIMVHAAPIRSIVAAATLKRSLIEQADNPSIFARQFQDRINYVESRVVPQYAGDLGKILKSGDSKELAQHLNFIDELRKTPEGKSFADSIMSHLSPSDLSQSVKKSISDNDLQLATRILKEAKEAKLSLPEQENLLSQAAHASVKAGDSFALGRVFEQMSSKEQSRLAQELVIEHGLGRGSIGIQILSTISSLEKEDFARLMQELVKMPKGKISGDFILNQILDSRARYSPEGQSLIRLALENATPTSGVRHNMIDKMAYYFGSDSDLARLARTRYEELEKATLTAIRTELSSGAKVDIELLTLLLANPNPEVKQLYLQAIVRNEGKIMGMQEEDRVKNSILFYMRNEDKLKFIRENSQYFSDELYKKLESELRAQRP